MLRPSIGLPPHTLYELFPFHLVFDRNFRILQVGGGWKKTDLSITPDSHLHNLFTCKHPVTEWNFDRFRRDPRSIFVFQSVHGPLKLRGGMTFLAEQDVILFLASPWITQIADLDLLGLSLNDFAPHDPLPDLLFLLQAQSSSLAELAALTDQLTEAKEAAEGAVKLQNQFLANMSHEIRTPLNGIMGMTQLTLNTSLDEQQTRYLHVVNASADALLAVLNDILDYSKMQAGTLQLECAPMDLRHLIQTTLAPLSVSANQKHLQLEYSVDPLVPVQVLGDPVRFRQVLQNLAGNAVKFTGAGKVSIHLQHLESLEQTSRLELTVTDTGIGIPADSIAWIFLPFTQVDGSATRQYGGTGLGLSVTKQLVEAMRGTVNVVSTVGEGSTFSITFVVALPKAIEPGSSCVSKVSFGQIKSPGYSTTDILLM